MSPTLSANTINLLLKLFFSFFSSLGSNYANTDGLIYMALHGTCNTWLERYDVQLEHLAEAMQSKRRVSQSLSVVRYMLCAELRELSSPR